MKIKIYGIYVMNVIYILLKISKWSDFYLWSYGSIYHLYVHTYKCC